MGFCVAACIILAIVGVKVESVFAAQTESFDVRTTITARFAETVIKSRVRNERQKSEKVGFQVLLPKEAFISGFSMTIDGKTYESVVEEKVKAQKVFQAARELNRTAGLVETREESTKAFKTSVNIEAGKVVEFRLVYQQLLRRIRGKYRHQLILLGSQLTNALSIEVDICETKRITLVNVPPILDSNGNSVTVNTTIRKQSNSAHVEYLQGNNDGVIESLSASGGSFVTEYELAQSSKGEIVVDDRFFVFFYAPEVKIEPRRVVFMLDVSGSMGGNKIVQLQQAMINIIDKLTEEDQFTVATFNHVVSVWKNVEQLHVATRSNIEDAKAFVRNMEALGGTNINDALLTSLRILHNEMENSTNFDTLTNYAVLLTDGLPTAGESIPTKILSNVDFANVKKLRVHAIGFGENVDTAFLKALSARNNGTWTQILADTTAALQIQNYLEEISVPFLKDIQINYPAAIVDEFIVHKPDSFLTGGEVVVLGRLKEELDPRNRGPFSIEVSGKYKENVISRATFHLDDPLPNCPAVGANAARDFGRKAFALTEVTEILRQYDAETNEEIKKELKERAVNKSITAGLATPVTSLLVIKPEDRRDIEEKLGVDETTAIPPTTTWVAPTTNPWWQVQGDPHFVVHLTESISACFNWLGKDGEVFNLLNDPMNSIVINGLVEGPKTTAQSENHAIFITKLAIILQREQLVIIIDSHEAIVRDTSSRNKRERDLKLPMVNVAKYKASYSHVTFCISDINPAHTVLNVTVFKNISFIVNLHHPVKSQNGAIDHLDLIISGSEELSAGIGGIFGQFPQKPTDDAENLASIEKAGTKTFLWYKNEVTPVKRTSMIVPYLKRKVPCWFVAKPSMILGAAPESFKMRNLFQIPKKKRFSH